MSLGQPWINWPIPVVRDRLSQTLADVESLIEMFPALIQTWYSGVFFDRTKNLNFFIWVYVRWWKKIYMIFRLAFLMGQKTSIYSSEYIFGWQKKQSYYCQKTETAASLYRRDMVVSQKETFGNVLLYIRQKKFRFLVI